MTHGSVWANFGNEHGDALAMCILLDPFGATFEPPLLKNY